MVNCSWWKYYRCPNHSNFDQNFLCNRIYQTRGTLFGMWCNTYIRRTREVCRAMNAQWTKWMWQSVGINARWKKKKTRTHHQNKQINWSDRPKESYAEESATSWTILMRVRERMKEIKETWIYIKTTWSSRNSEKTKNKAQQKVDPKEWNNWMLSYHKSDGN